MFFAKYNINNVTTAELYSNWEQFSRDTFNPYTRVYTLIEFVIHGKDYQSRKTSLHDLAVEWSNADTEGICLSDLCDIQNWFYLKGKRYGLLEEFRENAIC